MKQFRLSKYSPGNRDSTGAYVQSEWTSVSDVGRKFPPGVLLLESYLATENSYLAAIDSFLTAAGARSLIVDELEPNWNLSRLPAELRHDSLRELRKLRDGDSVSGENLVSLIRAVLRELVWCKLRSDRLYIHFGYDYYVYIGVLDDVVVPDIGTDLFLENFDSPYR